MPAKNKPQGKAPTVAGPLEFKQASTLEHDRELVSARYSLCGKYIFAGSYDSNVYRWDVAKETKTTLSSHNGWIQGLAFHPDKKRLFTGDSWGGLCAWNYADETPKPLWTRTDAHSRWMRAMAISPDGNLLATCGADRIIKLWSTQDGSPKWESPAQGDDLHSVAFHPNGALLVGDLKGVITHWDLTTHSVVRTLDAKILYLRPIVSGVPEINDVGGVRSMAFDKDAKILAASGSQPVSSGFFTGKPTIVLIDWETGKQKETLQWGNAEPSEGVTLDVVWHPDGFVMASSSGQPGKGAFYCWKPAEKSPFYIEKKLAHSRSASLNPDGDRLACLQVGPSSRQG
ncbi:MAG TPA: hypothetical protein VFC46_02025, partial [Humisphaera sp.]|nr:hypothetical protein [Humisphaera sp.]